MIYLYDILIWRPWAWGPQPLVNSFLYEMFCLPCRYETRMLDDCSPVGLLVDLPSVYLAIQNINISYGDIEYRYITWIYRISIYHMDISNVDISYGYIEYRYIISIYRISIYHIHISYGYIEYRYIEYQYVEYR